MSILKEFGFKNSEILEEHSYYDMDLDKPVHSKHDAEVSEKQVALFEKYHEYIQGCIDSNKVIRDQPELNELKLTNYEFKFKNGYLWIVDKISVDEKGNPYKYATISPGNAKLEGDMYSQFIIFNILQRVSCPWATENCRRFCYANKSNNRYTLDNEAVKSRKNNTLFSMVSNFDEIMMEVILYVTTNSNKRTFFRFHEAGDIYSKTYYSKIKNIMNNAFNVKFLLYTKSLFVLDDINEVNKKPNVCIRFSMDNSTSRKVRDKVAELYFLNTIVIDKNDFEEAFSRDNTVKIICNSHRELDHIKYVLYKIKEQKGIILEEIKNKNRKSKLQTYNTTLNKRITSLTYSNKCNSCLRCLRKDLKTIIFAEH